jgi:hypothetical protein
VIKLSAIRISAASLCRKGRGARRIAAISTPAALRCLVVLSLAAVLAGCGSSKTSQAAPSPVASAPSRISSTGQIKILSPAAGETVTGNQTTVRIELTGAQIDPVVSTNIKPDRGHVHLKLDGRLVTILGGLEEPLTGLQPGQHLLEVQFVASDHGPFNPPVISTVTFTSS